MPKKIIITLLVLVLILIVGVIISFAALSVYKPDVIRQMFNKPYSVVYLSTGEIYVGRLSVFPRLVLTDAYLLQVVPDQADPTKQSYQLAPMKEALWSPEKIYLNDDQVIFTASISAESEVAKTLKGK